MPSLALDDARARHSLWTGLLIAACGAIAFSGKAVIVKLSYRYGVDAVVVIFYRMLFALPLFALLAWWSSRAAPKLTRHDWLVVLGLGFSGYYLASILDFWGLQYIGASLERLILYLNPTVVLLLSVLLYKQRVTRAQWGALILSYIGVLIVFGHDLTLSGSHVALGTALVFGSAMSYAMYLVFSGAAVKRLGALRLSGLATTVACLLCIAVLYFAQTGGNGGGTRGALARPAERDAVHVRPGTTRHDRHRTHRRLTDGADGHGRPALDDFPERMAAGRTIHRVGRGGYGACAERGLAFGEDEELAVRSNHKKERRRASKKRHLDLFFSPFSPFCGYSSCETPLATCPPRARMCG